jgi:hypothetical protein
MCDSLDITYVGGLSHVKSRAELGLPVLDRPPIDLDIIFLSHHRQMKVRTMTVNPD